MSLDGQQIDRYHILHAIGRGGMGSVYLAEDARIGQQVAIKVISMEMSSDVNRDREEIHLFHREAKAIAKLDHPHILPLFDYGEEHFTNTILIYLVMPYRQEGSLLDRLRERSPEKYLSPQEVAHFVHQAADALQHAHSRQIIHQDVKPSNFLIRNRAETSAYPDVLLADFGIATLATATSGVSQSVRGTPTYMAPEQWEGKSIPATDQYGLAVMTYELLTGHRPFQGGFGQMMYQHLNTQPAPPSTLNPHLSREIDTILLTALAKAPNMRFASITAFARAFSMAAQSMDTARPTVQLNTSTSSDYHAVLAISTAEALNGTTRMLTLPGGRQVTASVPAQIQDGQMIRLEGQGVSFQDGRPSGALILTIAVKSAEEPHSISQLSGVQPSNFTSNSDNSQTIVHASGPSSVEPRGIETVPLTPSIALTPILPIPPHPATPLPLPAFAPPAHRPRKRTLALLGLIAILLLPILYLTVSFLHIGTSQSHLPQNGLPQLPAGIGVVKAPTGESIGISDGSFAFDTSLPDADLKLQAAAKMRANDSDGATLLWRQAIEKSSNDAEALIYLADLQARQSGQQLLTIVIGTTLTGAAGPIAIGEGNLRGAFVAQEEYNNGKKKLPGGIQVYLLIANSGSNQAYATPVAQQIAQLSSSEKTIVGVMGWTADPQMLNAVTVLAHAHIPMVSNAGADQLTGRSTYSFRVITTGATQGSLGARFLEKTLHAKTVALFTDPTDNFSRAVAGGLTKTFTGDGNTIVATEHFTTGKPQTTPMLLQDALSKHPDAIYFAGRAADASPLLAHIRPADRPIVGPSPLYQVTAYAPAARPGVSHLNITAGAYPDEWEFLGLQAQKPRFFGDFRADFDPHGQHRAGTYAYDRPAPGDILSYDAISVLLYASSNALTKDPFFLGKDSRGSVLWQNLSEVTGPKAFQGVSGAISFGPDGGVVDKASAIVCADKNNHFRLEAVLGQFLVEKPPLTQFPTSSVCA